MSSDKNGGDGILVVLLIVIGLPCYLAECAGRPSVAIELRVDAKHFNSGKHACYQLTLKAEDGATDTYCAQPEEYAAIGVGDRVTVKAFRGRVTNGLYVSSDSLQGKMPAEHQR